MWLNIVVSNYPKLGEMMEILDYTITSEYHKTFRGLISYSWSV